MVERVIMFESLKKREPMMCKHAKGGAHCAHCVHLRTELSKASGFLIFRLRTLT